jgi:thiol-disulfide isomerase/thioredoxin
LTPLQAAVDYFGRSKNELIVMPAKYLTMLCLLLGAAFMQPLLAQPSYYQTPEGKIVDSATYTQQKAAEETQFRKALAQKVPGKAIYVIDKKRLVRKNADSVLYSYKRIISMDDRDSSGMAPPGPEDYIGQPFPLSQLRTLSGDTLTLESLKGKPTMINFWFTTCKPCIDEMPVLNGLRQKMNGRANFVAVTFEPGDKAAAFLQTHPFDFLQVADAKPLTAALQMQTYPVNIFLDKHGVIRQVEGGIPYIVKGGRKAKPKIGNAKEFQAILQSLL